MVERGYGRAKKSDYLLKRGAMELKHGEEVVEGLTARTGKGMDNRTPKRVPSRGERWSTVSGEHRGVCVWFCRKGSG